VTGATVQEIVTPEHRKLRARMYLLCVEDLPPERSVAPFALRTHEAGVNVRMALAAFSVGRGKIVKDVALPAVDPLVRKAQGKARFVMLEVDL